MSITIPSPQPSFSDSPSSQPSVALFPSTTAVPTAVPSSKSLLPSAQPSGFKFPLISLTQTNVDIEFSRTTLLEPDAINAWQAITGEAIKDEATDAVGEENIEDIRVGVQLTLQSITTNPSTRLLLLQQMSSSRERQLQNNNNNNSNLTVTFDVTMDIRTVAEANGLVLALYIGGAFDEPAERDDYIVKLRQTQLPEFNGILFEGISEGGLLETGPPTSTQQRPSSGDSPNLSRAAIAVIITAVVVFVAALVLFGTFFFRRDRRKSSLTEN